MLNLNNRDLLATTLQAEAGNQGPVGMMSVGSVIMNRLKKPGLRQRFTSGDFAARSVFCLE